MIRERGEGLQVMVYAGRDPLSGKKRWVSRQIPGQTRASWREARKVEGELLAEVEAGKRRAAGSMRLAQLLDEWLTWRESNGKPISPSTLHSYRLTIESKIKPGLGKAKLTEIDARTLDRYYTALRQEGSARRAKAKDDPPPAGPAGKAADAGAEGATSRRGKGTAAPKASKGRTGRATAAEPRDGATATDTPAGASGASKGERPRKGGPLSASRVRDIHAILSGALGLAARWGYIPFNPAVLAKPPAARNAPRKLPTQEQAKELLKAAKDEPEFELFLRISASTGLRRGEVCALRWGDVDLDAGSVTVSGNVLFIRGAADGFIHKGPKSDHGERVLALDAGTVELLRAHRARCAARALAAGASLAEGAYLFSREPDGARPIRPDFVTRRFTRLAESLGHDYTLHGLRHFVATQLGMVAEAGTIRTRMGHGSLAVSSIYVRPTAEADRAAAEHMGKVLDA